jgi:hypothetical protein
MFVSIKHIKMRYYNIGGLSSRLVFQQALKFRQLAQLALRAARVGQRPSSP